MKKWCALTARSKKLIVLVSCLISGVGELRKAPRMSLFAAFCRTLKIFSTFFLFLVVSQTMLLKSILGFKTAVISNLVSRGLSPQKQICGGFGQWLPYLSVASC